MLTPVIPAGVPNPGVGIADPANLGDHKFSGGDTYGTVYTCAGGFIDLGHLRDQIDVTRYYYEKMKDQKLFVANASLPATAYDGVITIKKAVPEADKIDVARSITYDQSVVHEIFTYWDTRSGFHNSSFSPEDLVSNFLGTYVAGIAIKAKGSFDTAATKALNDLMSALNARPPAGTTQAFTKITTVYITAPNDYLKLRFLRRRNFNVKEIKPCLIPGITGCTSTTFPSTVPTKFDDRIKTYYDMEFTTPDDFFARRFSKAKAKIGTSLKLAGFDAAIETIKADAANIPEYGANFSSCAL